MTITNSTKYVTPVPKPSSVRLVPQLCLAALRTKLDKELAIWYCLRATNKGGSGWLDTDIAIAALTGTFRYFIATAYRLLRSGPRQFWSYGDSSNSRIKIYGLRMVAEYFNVSCGWFFVQMPVGQFVGDGKDRVKRQRACFYAAFHKPEGMKATPMSREAIKEATGVPVRTQQRYYNSN